MEDNKPVKETIFTCKKCKDQIGNTHKRLTYCSCGAMGIDSCEYYFRVIGKREDWEINKPIVES